MSWLSGHDASWTIDKSRVHALAETKVLEFHASGFKLNSTSGYFETR